jgi:uncharacterized protein
MIKFDWDNAKSKANILKHGVSFEEAITVFDDENTLFIFDGRFDYGEERFAAIGASGIRILFVVHTDKNETIRIISARRATKSEVNQYVRR